ncbi:MAG: 3-deoxy-manno-octulosonate cytidylyltransferase [Polyangiaceae bacterium]
MEVVALIPARHASERFPGKALVPIAGVPMIVRVEARVRRAEGIDATYVVTDDDRIERAVREAGGRVLRVDEACASGTDRIARAAGRLECTWVVNVQGDEPLVAPDVVSEVVRTLRRGDADIVTVATPMRSASEEGDPNVVKVVRDATGRALYFSRACIPHRTAPGDPEGTVRPRKHVGLYGFRKDYLLRFAGMPPSPLEKTERLEQLRAMEAGHTIRVIDTDHDTVGVDVPADVAKVEAILSGATG